MGLTARSIGLPPLVGYLVAGFALNGYGISGSDMIKHVAETGVLLLLFSVGLKLRLKNVARSEVLLGTLLHMVVFSAFVSVLVYFSVGSSWTTSVVIALALSFSSTVVAAKVLEEKRELRAFHGRVAIGILIMQDLVAVAFLSTASGQMPSPWALLIFALPLLRGLIHKLLDLSGHDDLMLLFGLVLALVAGGAGFHALGLSAELGAVVLGVLLAGHDRASELSNALWGLKEIFLIGFFLQIGMSGIPTWETFGFGLLLLLLLPVKMVLFFFVLLSFGVRARTALLAGLSLTTFSEFGLIAANVAVDNGWLGNDWLVLLAVVVALSFVVAAPANRLAHTLYDRYASLLCRFELARRHPDDVPISIGSSNLMIVGMGRVGTGAYDFLNQRQMRVIGLDSDPGKVEKHRSAGRRVLYADAEDSDLWSNINLDSVEAIMLAMPDVAANRAAVIQLRKRGYKGRVSATGVFPEDVVSVLEAGADDAYNYFAEAGVGFAEHVWESLGK